MASTQDEDMYLFQGTLDPPTSAFAGQDFDTFLTADDQEQGAALDTYLNPNDLIKKESESPNPDSLRFSQSHRGSDSSSSSSEPLKYHDRNNSEVSASSSTVALPQKSWGSGINGFTIPASEQFPEDASMTGLDQDYEASNMQMASDFDFETAASTPSGYNPATARTAAVQPLRRTAHRAHFGPPQRNSTDPPAAAPPSFFFAGSREVSPLNAMLPAQGQSPWSKHSPSAGLEETFNHINMNGDSPGNINFSPSMHFPGANFGFDAESSTTPSSFDKAVSSPPSTINSTDGALPQLTVHPTSLKSRVETQIPIKLTLSFLPPGAKKLRLPTHTVSKPKFLVKGEVERSPDILEVHTSLVCTSAMQKPAFLRRALARARGDELGPFTRPSPASSTSSTSSRDDEDKPLNGGEVRICAGCIQRERKRASRKKQKKPEEEEMFQKDEERRVVVFNTNEIKDWTEVPRDVPPSANGTPSPPPPPPTGMQVELPMRIACYCRHQNEKLGFQVIFTIKDSRDKLIAQALTNPIMITDDHKTHNVPTTVQHVPASLPTAPQVPGAGVFSTAGAESAPPPSTMPKMFKQSFSTTDLQGLQHNFNPNFPLTSTHNPFAIPPMSSQTSSTLTPRNLSRPASPSGPSGPTAKKRKQSGSGKLPQGLTMTRLDTIQATSGSTTMPNTAASSPYAPNMTSFMQPQERPFQIGPLRPNGTSPPTPTGNDPYAANINRSFSLENLPRQGLISAPSSRQPSRPGSPVSGRNSFGATDAQFSQSVSNQLLGQHTRRPPPLIHKLVPAEGSITGGTEVTLLGNGFYQGLEVMFGDTEATTTTFWGEKCLNCITPPAIQPGTVAVVFKHEHPQYATSQHSQTRHSLFTYTDDRELEMFRLALRTIGKQMQHPTDDPYSAAQQLIQQQSMWSSHSTYGAGAGAGHQRYSGMAGGAATDLPELENTMVHLLEYIDLNAPTGLQRLDIRRPSGLTLLHLASSLGLTRFVAGLLARGASPDLVDNNGQTPMHHAAMHGHTHIIHRLRLSGASHTARSIRNFLPADLATTLLAYQAAMTPMTHYRSRSVGGTPMRLQSRRGSSASLHSFWEKSTASYYDSDSDDIEDDANESAMEETGEMHQLRKPSPVVSLSRRGSAQHNKALATIVAPTVIDGGPNASPSAFMLAWRDHLVNQLQQFNASAQSVMPSLATLNGPMQALQEYQTMPMVRRVSSLLPQRPSSRQREGWWESLTGAATPAAASPPAYGDLYPDQEQHQADLGVKKQSALLAAADAIADAHFEGQSSSPAKPKSQQSGTLLTRQPIERVALSRDRKLFFFWIPLLAIVLGLMIKNSGLLELLMNRSLDNSTPVQGLRQKVVEVL